MHRIAQCVNGCERHRRMRVRRRARPTTGSNRSAPRRSVSRTRRRGCRRWRAACSSARSVEPTTRVGSVSPLGKCSASVSIAGHRFRLYPELLGLRQPDRCGQQAGAQQLPAPAIATAATHPGLRATAGGDSVPDSAVGKGFGAGLRNERPEQSPAEQCQQRRQHQQHEDRRHHETRCGLHAKAAGARRRGEQQGQQRQHDGGVAGQDRWPGLADRHAQGRRGDRRCGPAPLDSAR